MESQSGSGSNIHHTTHHSTNSNESEPFNTIKKPELSHDHHIHFMPISTTTTPHNENPTFLHTNDQTNSSTNLANPFGEFHSPYPNNSDPSFSSTQNPFLVFGDHNDANESHKLHDHAPFEPNFHHQLPTFESSLGNPFHENETHHHDHGNVWHHQDHWNFPNHEETSHASSSSQPSHPLFTLESTQNQQLDNEYHKNHRGFESSTQQHMDDSLSVSSNTERDTHAYQKSRKDSDDDMLVSSMPKHEQKALTQQNMHDSHSTSFESSSPQHKHDSLSASSNTEKDTHVHPKSQKENMLASESSDDDFPVRSMPKHEQKKSSTLVVVPETIQNPPIQIMERQENCSVTPSSTPRIPLHVFARDRLNAQWSGASNESLFSIQMGKSFSNDMAWLTKSGELDKNVDHMDKNVDHMNMSGGVQSNHPPLSPQTHATKFNDISTNFAEQHESNSKVTEATAAETMREVIMETSTAPENNKSKGPTTFFNAAMHSDALSSSNNDHSRHSNGSTQSFAFKSYADGDKTHLSHGDKTHSSKHGEETKKQLKQTEQQNSTKTTVAPSAAQNTKPASNASQNKWLSCFTCCH
ncbi:unnamed protein product [Vicia faba]|uniref:Uncharacterized protein n=1 Tax=Vicia faba TaxID=3906 RepID=A0AAV0ZEG7_VICFA|nr:unnamed protein product [Vicia faba]